VNGNGSDQRCPGGDAWEKDVVTQLKGWVAAFNRVAEHSGERGIKERWGTWRLAETVRGVRSGRRDFMQEFVYEGLNWWGEVRGGVTQQKPRKGWCASRENLLGGRSGFRGGEKCARQEPLRGSMKYSLAWRLDDRNWGRASMVG